MGFLKFLSGMGLIILGGFFVVAAVLGWLFRDLFTWGESHPPTFDWVGTLLVGVIGLVMIIVA